MEMKIKSGESVPVDGGIRVCLSSECVDRDGDIIVQQGIDLANFKKNPIVLFGHNSRSLPIGRVDPDSIVIENGATFGTVKFADYDFAKTVEKLYQDGIMKAWSIGFCVKEYEPREDEEGKTLGWKIIKSELYELSAVNVPANPEALVSALKSFDPGVARQIRKAFEMETGADIKREVERGLCDLGYTRNEAKEIVSKAGQTDAAGCSEGAGCENLPNVNDEIKSIFSGFSFIKEGK